MRVLCDPRSRRGLLLSSVRDLLSDVSSLRPDVNVVCADGVVGAHALILAATSPLLKEALEGAGADGCQEETLIVARDLDASQVRQFFHAMLSERGLRDGDAGWAVARLMGMTGISTTPHRKTSEKTKNVLPSGRKVTNILSSTACPICSRVFSSRQSLRNHRLLHEGRRSHSCSDCDRRFVTSGALLNHRRRMHDGTAPRHPCPHCRKSLGSASNLARHVRAVHFEHSDKATFPCTKCGKEFKDPSGLSAHAKIHSDVKDFQCKSCDKFFRTAAILRIHTRIHTGERPFPCSDCGRAFSTRGRLTAHRDNRHRGVRAARKHVCPDCGAAFVKRQDLDVHHLKHTGERPHRCQHCPRRFRSTRHLKEHVVIHSPEKPFLCTSCFKTFRSSSALKQHGKTKTCGRLQSKFSSAQGPDTSLYQGPPLKVTDEESSLLVLDLRSQIKHGGNMSEDKESNTGQVSLNVLENDM